MRNIPITRAMITALSIISLALLSKSAAHATQLSFTVEAKIEPFFAVYKATGEEIKDNDNLGTFDLNYTLPKNINEKPQFFPKEQGFKFQANRKQNIEVTLKNQASQNLELVHTTDNSQKIALEISLGGTALSHNAGVSLKPTWDANGVSNTMQLIVKAAKDTNPTDLLAGTYRGNFSIAFKQPA